MSNQNYSNGIRKANKAIASLSLLMGKKMAAKILRNKVDKYFSKMLQARDLGKTIAADFNKGMWIAYSYYVSKGRRLDERDDILS